MSKDDPNFKRLGTILFLFVIVLILSIAQAVLLNDPDPYDEITEKVDAMGAFDIAVDILSFFVGAFIVKMAILLPAYMVAIITPVYILLILTFWYLVLDFIKDIEIFGWSI